MKDGTTAFADRMREFGLEPPASIEPEKLYRFPGVGKPNGNQAAWCKLFVDGMCGVFGDWSAGLSETWQVDKAHEAYLDTAGMADREPMLDAGFTAESRNNGRQLILTGRGLCFNYWHVTRRTLRHLIPPYHARRRTVEHRNAEQTLTAAGFTVHIDRDDRWLVTGAGLCLTFNPKTDEWCCFARCWHAPPEVVIEAVQRGLIGPPPGAKGGECPVCGRDFFCIKYLHADKWVAVDLDGGLHSERCPGRPS